MVSFYRLPVTLRKMRQADSWAWRKKIAAQQSLEVFWDGILALESLVILITLYRAFEFVAKMSDILRRHEEPTRRLRACGHRHTYSHIDIYICIHVVNIRGL